MSRKEIAASVTAKRCDTESFFTVFPESG